MHRSRVRSHAPAMPRDLDTRAGRCHEGRQERRPCAQDARAHRIALLDDQGEDRGVHDDDERDKEGRLTQRSRRTEAIEVGSLAPHVQNFTRTAFLPSSPRCQNREILNESRGEEAMPTLGGVTSST
jgi:hypothetical protein